MSMQPMLTIQSQGVLVVDQRRVDPALSRRPLARRDLDAEARDPLRHPLRRVLLEERLAVGAVGIAPHRERPVAQVRHEHARDRAVVVDQVALRDPLVVAARRPCRGWRASPFPPSSRPGARAARPPPACRRGAPGRKGRAGGRRASTPRTRPRPRASARPRRRRPSSPSASSGRPGTAARLRRSGSSFSSSSRMARSSKPVPTFPTHSHSSPRWTPSTSAPKLPLRRPWPFV